MKKTVTCIVCPRGCTMMCEIAGEGITVTGNACARGEKHAVGECTNPVRSLTSIVRVKNRTDTMVSVKSAAPIPKGELFAVMEKIRAASVEAPVAMGDVILADICGTDIIATKTIL